MSIDGISGMGGMTGFADQQTFGAGVVSATLDSLNNASGQAALEPVDQQTFGAAVVGKTLDYMNSGGLGSVGGMSQTYDFAKDVLSSYMSGTGTLANMNI